MTVCDQPVHRAQDLIDRLKFLTRPIGEAETKDLPALWNELEDLLIMLATTKKALDDHARTDTLRRIIAAIDDYRTTEKKDADTDTEPGRVNCDRGSSDSDSARDQGRTSSTGHTSSEGDQGSSVGAAGSD